MRIDILNSQSATDTSSQDQWKKKKQTKEQAAAARKAKLDPDSAKTAKDIMDERARKRKLEELEDFGGSDVEGVQRELPKEGLKQPQNKKAKKQKVSTDAQESKAPTEDTPRKQKLSKNEKKQLKKQKKEALDGKVTEKEGQKASPPKPVSENEADIAVEVHEDNISDVNMQEPADLPNG
jgi:hypothetical protein